MHSLLPTFLTCAATTCNYLMSYNLAILKQLR